MKNKLYINAVLALAVIVAGCSNPEAELKNKEITDLLREYSSESVGFSLSSIDAYNKSKFNLEKELEKSLESFCGGCWKDNKEHLAKFKSKPTYELEIGNVVFHHVKLNDYPLEVLPYLAFRTHYVKELNWKNAQPYYDSLSKMEYLCGKIKDARERKIFSEDVQKSFEQSLLNISRERLKYIPKVMSEMSQDLWVASGLLDAKFENSKEIDQCNESYPNDTSKNVWTHRVECERSVENDFKDASVGNVNLLTADLSLIKSINGIVQSHSCIIPKDKSSMIHSHLDNFENAIKGALEPTGSYMISNVSLQTKIGEIKANGNSFQRLFD